jgi:Holliday junction DNA helicase RuvA
MIASLTGTLKSKAPTEVVVDVNGVGYVVSIPLSTFETLGSLNSTVTLLTHLHVREDALLLFGFSTDEERTCFRLLISVSGIGPKIAQGILSSMSVNDLRIHIAAGNASALTSIPGIGRKTAERLILELKEKMEKLAGSTHTLVGSTDAAEIRAEALAALVSLGYNRATAESAIRKAVAAEQTAGLTLEQLIKFSLRLISSNA